MRIAIVRSRYTPFGGAERFVERALATLAAQGHQVSIVARSWAGSPAAGIAAVTVDPPVARWRGRAARDRAFATAVRAHLAAADYDIVQSHERIPGVMIFRAGDGVHAAWLRHRARAPRAGGRWLDAFSPYHRYVVAAERAMFADPALRAVICNSRMVADEVSEFYGVAADKLVVIHNGVDLDAFHPALAERHRAEVRAELGIAAAAPVFLYVGSGYARKGVPTLLDAFARLADPAARLLIVGADRKLAAHARDASRRGLGDRVRFLGARQDVRPLLGAADAFVLPTLYDPFPNAVVEALACGLPVVTSTTCGARELIRDGDNGWVVDAVDAAALAARMRLLAEPGRAAAMRGAARASVEQLTLAAMAGQLTALYARLAADTSAPPDSRRQR